MTTTKQVDISTIVHRTIRGWNTETLSTLVYRVGEQRRSRGVTLLGKRVFQALPKILGKRSCNLRDFSCEMIDNNPDRYILFCKKGFIEIELEPLFQLIG